MAQYSYSDTQAGVWIEKNWRGYTYATTISTDTSITWLDTGYLGKLIKVVKLELGGQDAGSNIRYKITVYNKNGTTETISRFTSATSALDKVPPGELTRQLSQQSGSDSIWLCRCYDSTNDKYIIDLKTPIYCYGLKVEVYNISTSTQYGVAGAIIYAEVEKL